MVVAVLVRYLLLDNEIYEVQRLKHKPSSWFIDDTVEEGMVNLLCDWRADSERWQMVVSFCALELSHFSSSFRC